MPEQDPSIVACGACGKKYPRSSAVNRQFKCTCGTITHLPEAASSAQGEDEYDLVVETPPPPKARPKSSSVNQAVKSRMGVVPVAKPLGPNPEAAEAAKKLERLLAPSPIRDWVIPGFLLAIGLVLCTYDVLHGSEHPPASVAKALPYVFMRAVLSMGVVVGAIFLATAFFDVVVLGSFRNSIFRLCAIAVAPSSIYGVLVYAIGDVGGAAAGTFASVGLYALLYFLLMRMDLKDTSVCVIITFVMVTMVNYFMYKYQSASSGSWI